MTITTQIASGSTGTLACPDARGVYPELRVACAGVSIAENGPLTAAFTVFNRAVIFGLSIALLLLPSSLRARTSRLQQPEEQSVQSQRESDDEARERQREREEEKREREEEQRDRAQEKREAEQDRADRQQELYDDGREALDDDQYEKALSEFTELVKMNGAQTDAGLYWKAYSENKLGKKAAALASIAELKGKFPQSRWKKDAEVLELEVRGGGTSQNVTADSKCGDELVPLALQGIMNSDPARGIAIIEKRLNSPGCPKEKPKLLFILAQSGQPQAMEILAKIARGQSNPESQRKAVEYLSMFGGAKAHAMLQEIYQSTGDESVKAIIIRSHLLNGDRASLLAEAKGEKSENLRREAIRTLGLTGGTSELEQLYQAETSIEVKREILQAFFLSGDSKRMEQAALNEKDLELRRTAIRNLGLMGQSDLLQSLYAKETDQSLKEECLNGLFLAGNAKGLVAIAKGEKDPGLKKKAIEKLSLMGSKEGNDYLMEILDK